METNSDIFYAAQSGAPGTEHLVYLNNQMTAQQQVALFHHQQQQQQQQFRNGQVSIFFMNTCNNSKEL